MVRSSSTDLPSSRSRASGCELHPATDITTPAASAEIHPRPVVVMRILKATYCLTVCDATILTRRVSEEFGEAVALADASG